MYISLMEPLSNGWQRMKTALFRPFDIGKWFVIGFTAFLAGLMDGPGGGGGGKGLSKDGWNGFEELRHLPEEISYWFSNNPGWAMFIFFAVVVVVCLILLATWLSSRGAFMFLDNVVQNRAEVKRPWREFREVGNSLFIWRLIFGFLSFIFVIYMVVFILAGIGIFYFASFGQVSWLTLLSAVVFFLLVLIVIAYASMFTNNFVVPIMYHKNVPVLEGWRIFLNILRERPGSFILYGLFLLLLHILIILAVMAVGFLTCCFGFVLVMLPYIGSVVLLPVSYTFRAYSVAFLEQFGDDFKIFPSEDVTPPVETV